MVGHFIAFICVKKWLHEIDDERLAIAEAKGYLIDSDKLLAFHCLN